MYACKTFTSLALSLVFTGVASAESLYEPVVTAIEATCQEVGRECTYHATVNDVRRDEYWEGNLELISGPLADGELERAMQESLFDVFAYDQFSPEQQAQLAARLRGQLGAQAEAAGVTYEFYRNPNADLFFGVQEVLRESCSVGGPDSSLIVKATGVDAYLEISSDVCD
jgi:hypothetical protein